MLVVASSVHGFESLKAVNVQKIVQKAQKRLTTELVSVCTVENADFEVDEEGTVLTGSQLSERGVSAVRGLQQAVQKLMVVQELADAVGPKSSVDDEGLVCSAMRSADLAGFKYPPLVMKLAIVKAFRRVLVEGDVDKVVKFLAIQDKPDKCPSSLADITEPELRAEMQASRNVKHTHFKRIEYI